jgi:hypothetical protein
LGKYHIQAKDWWEPFLVGEIEHGLDHLKVHEVTYEGETLTYSMVVTYGLHCFAKDDTEHSIEVTYSDGKEIRQIDLERYEASKQLRGIVEGFARDDRRFFQTTTEKFFTIPLVNSASGQVEPYKVCFCIFKENRLLRIHVTTAFFDRRDSDYSRQKQFSIFKIAKDAVKGPKRDTLPIEARGKF